MVWLQGAALNNAEVAVNWRRTIDSKIAFRTVGYSSFVPALFDSQLSLRHEDGFVHFWGSRLIPGVLPQYGDVLAFTGQNHLHHVATITGSAVAEDLGDALWPSSQKGEFQLVYSLSDIQEIDIEYGDIWPKLNWKSNYAPRALMLPDKDGQQEELRRQLAAYMESSESYALSRALKTLKRLERHGTSAASQAELPLEQQRIESGVRRQSTAESTFRR